MKPLAIDLYCGLGGWADGFLAEGYRVIGFDIEAHDYGTGGYPGELVLRDVRSIHGSEFKDATIIVGSPPCQAYSYRAMPWKRAKALPPPDNTLFDSCFRIQREASEAAGRYIPLIVENVRGAQKWVGRAQWNFGSYYLWGDVPALMPIAFKGFKSHGTNWSDRTKHGQDFTRIAGKFAEENVAGLKILASCAPRRWEDREVKRLRDNFGWSGTALREGTSHGEKRKRASALIAKIPFPLAQHIARCFKPDHEQTAGGQGPIPSGLSSEEKV
jgi:hypothetical protein